MPLFLALAKVTVVQSRMRYCDVVLFYCENDLSIHRFLISINDKYKTVIAKPDYIFAVLTNTSDIVP
jgi:hypothetical protein